ncbi:arabinose transporter [Enhydrobacter sp.]|jgi:MFS family permease|uniref:arabinose transporter n=1 Tax=Enhydrobacter sp. TaxID=1894999 RepID=UPI002620765F|nr:arabinose transporter [Enhydrobacter sp.]WIM09215.1 MAG: Xanthine transporter,putative [Enhydrobacter sp.]
MDQGISLGRTVEASRSLAVLLPIMGVVFAAFLVIGCAMPVLPLHVHDRLGLGTFVVGLVAGGQFAAALISRPWAGHYADSRGTKPTVVAGLLAAAVSGLFYLLSLRLAGLPALSATILLLGRLLLGGAESFVITGAVSWGLAIAGPQDTGRVIAWIGAAMFAAFALGAPVGAAFYSAYGFGTIALATTLAPLATLLLVAPLAPVVPLPQARAGFMRVLGSVWLPGLGSALSTVGFGAITAFVTLLFASRGWRDGWLPYTTFAAVFILARLAFGHLPDRMGGARVALVCVPIEAAGQALIWLAPSPALALLGAGLTGFGYSLVYPGFGVEAVLRVPAESRGLAMGAYTVFLDIALGAGSPILGLVAGGAGLPAVFLAGALAALCSMPIALWFTRPRERAR